MTFLHPWIVWLGLAAASLPVVVHFLTRPRPVRMPLSTLRFVRDAIRQRRARHRLRDFIILALRTLAVLLVALAMARPQIGPQPLVSDQNTGSTVRVVLLDASQSMAATDHGIQALERARTVAAGHLRYRPGLAADLVVAGAVPHAAFDQASTNFEALRDELARCQVLPQRMDVARAVGLAARILAPASEQDTRRRELVVVSDFQRFNWASADFSPLPAGTQIQLESVAPAVQAENLAILSASCRAIGAGGSAGRLAVEVGNFTPMPRKVTVEVAVGDSTYRLTGTCPAGRATTLADEIPLRESGWLVGEARLTGVEDALTADNRRAFAVHVRAQPVYALLTRQPGSQRPSSSHYLECALAPDARSQRTDDRRASATIQRIDPAGVSAAILAGADLLLLDHPGKLSEETIKLLAGLMRRGRPVLYVAAEPIDAVNLKRLGAAAGSGLQMPVEFSPPPAGQDRRDLFLTEVRGNEPPFRVFGEGLGALKDRLRFAGGLASRRLDKGLANDVLAQYGDGTACLVLTASDAGSLCVLNADLGQSSLPRTAAFVPLLSELTERMLARNRTETAAPCGEQLVANLPADAGPAGGLRIVPPGSGAPPSGAYGELADEAIGAVWRWSSPSPPGVYQIRRASDTVYALAVGVPSGESDLESLKPEVLKNRLAAGRDVYYRRATSAEGDPRDDAWTWFVTACVVCLLGELIALGAFRT